MSEEIRTHRDGVTYPECHKLEMVKPGPCFSRMMALLIGAFCG